MAGWKSEAQKRAFKEKRERPEAKVVCPTCGTDLVAGESKWGTYASCPKCKIFAGIRGL